MSIIGLDHIQIAMPKGEEEKTRHFYGQTLGFEEVDKPAEIRGRGGAWFQAGPVNLHVGVQEDFVPARKAHPGFLVESLSDMEAKLEAGGYEFAHEKQIKGYRRLFTEDPFGNRIELMEKLA
ncbi:VOC family protein [Flexibacterium corallicola]|uniref:VOC family protein n=1 Tax=Flexibacterium corallicola TaxID=3037259 RepID=UPI00286F1E04|nr:VOC family protein [Pseudovibrio sp. M1P-2-3]